MRSSSFKLIKRAALKKWILRTWVRFNCPQLTRAAWWRQGSSRSYSRNLTRFLRSKKAKTANRVETRTKKTARSFRPSTTIAYCTLLRDSLKVSHPMANLLGHPTKRRVSHSSLMICQIGYSLFRMKYLRITLEIIRRLFSKCLRINSISFFSRLIFIIGTSWNKKSRRFQVLTRQISLSSI